jgi:aminoglycoside phosphotransferase
MTIERGIEDSESRGLVDGGEVGIAKRHKVSCIPCRYNVTRTYDQRNRDHEKRKAVKKEVVNSTTGGIRRNARGVT